jgi:hypothetical protein
VLGTPLAFILSQDQTLHNNEFGLFLKTLLSYHSLIVNVRWSCRCGSFDEAPVNQWLTPD